MKCWLYWVASIALTGPGLIAAQWYAAPDGAANGDGTITNPWPLQIALNSPKVQPGDTLNLRGGYYRGPGFTSTLSGTSNSYVTVRSYPGEWAILTDGGYCILATNIPALTQIQYDSTGTMVTADALGWPYTYGVGNTQHWSSYMLTKYGNGVDIGYVPFSNAQYLASGTALKIDEEQFTIYNATYMPGRLGLYRGLPLGGGHSGTPAHTNGTKAYLIGTALQQGGSYVMFRDFEVCPTTFTNKVINDKHGATLMAGLNINGTGNKCFGIYAHDVFNGISPWSQGRLGELNGCVLWNCGVYDSSWSDNYQTNWVVGGWLRGVGFYGQGEGTSYKDCISFKNVNSGMKIYTSSDGSATVNDSSIRGCFTFQNGDGLGPEIAAAGGPSGFIVTNATIADCYMFAEKPMIDYQTPSNRNWTVVNNVIVASGFKIYDVISGTITNNTVLGEKVNPLTQGADYLNFECSQSGSNSLDLAHFILDHNHYYMRAWHVSNPTEFYVSFLGSGTFAWSLADWQQNLGFDLHSTYVGGDPRWNDGHADAWPTNYLDVAVRRLDYNTNRLHVCVVSTSGQTNLAFNLSNYGFNSGDAYTLRDAQNPLVTVRSNRYSGGAINLPLNLTNVVALVGNRNTNVHANVLYPGLFNVFILDRLPGNTAMLQPPSNLRVMSISQ